MKTITATTAALLLATTIAVAEPLPQLKAADTTLTLACQGTYGERALQPPKLEPISMGLIVNFASRTVQGFESIPGFSRWFNFPVEITSMNDVAVHFHGSDQSGSFARATSITGIINRVTGDVEADTGGQFNLRYALKCRSTQRMF